MMLQAHFGKKLKKRDAVIIFDEVQMYSQARAAIKYLVADGRYDYIETGSLILCGRVLWSFGICSDRHGADRRWNSVYADGNG